MTKIEFKDHPIVSKDRDSYIDIVVDTSKALESFRLSLMSFEVLDRNGAIKPDSEVDVAEQSVRSGLREKLAKGDAFEKPIVGLGLQDNFEIGVGRAVFVTLAMEGLKEIPVHVRKNQIDSLKVFAVTQEDVKSA